MAYCPRCGREQRCGCAECHVCGIALVESVTRSAEPARPVYPERPAAPDKTRRPAAADPLEPEPESLWSNLLARVFLILGLGLLLICVFDMINAARHLPVLTASAAASESIRRLGFYSGILLYTNSARVLTGFAFISGGALAGRRIEDGRGWEKAIRVTGLAMGGVSIVYALTALLVMLPIARPPHLLEALLPPLWASVPIFLITAGALFGAGFLMAWRLSGEGKRDSLRHRLHYRSPATGNEAEPMKPYEAHSGGGATH